MNKEESIPSRTRHNILKASALVAALGSGAISLVPGIASGKSETKQSLNKESISGLEFYTETKIASFEPVEWLSGKLSIREVIYDPYKHKSHVINVVIKNPLIAANNRGEGNSTSGISYGYVDRATDVPKVTFIDYNPKTMHLTVSNEADSKLNSVVFAPDSQGGISYSEGFDPQTHAPFVNSHEQPLLIGDAYVEQSSHNH